MRSSSSTQGRSTVLAGMVKTSTCGHHETDRQACRLTSTRGLQLTVRQGDLASRRKQWSWAAMRPLGPWEARSCSFLLHAPASVERMSRHGIVRACNSGWRLALRFPTLTPNSTRGSSSGTFRGRQCSCGRGRRCCGGWTSDCVTVRSQVRQEMYSTCTYRFVSS